MTEPLRDLIKRLKEEAESISHGPCFPLKVTNRFQTNRIEDCHGNVVIEQPDIWLSEAAEYFVNAGNALPRLLALAEAACDWLRAADSDAELCPFCDYAYEYGDCTCTRPQLAPAAREKVRAIVEGKA